MSGTLNETALTKARVQVPAWGRPWADVHLSKPTEFAVGAAVTLTIAGVAMKCTVVSGGVHEGDAGYRLVAGTGGWSKTLPAKSYINDAGVKAANVLRDAASACGETITDLPDTRLGPHYARAAGLASDTLHALASKNWYVDFAGVTHIGQRPATVYTGNAPRVHVDKAGQIVDLATETLAGLVPGVTVDGFAPATDVEFVLDANRLTARVWAGPAPASRRLGAIAAIVRSLTARDRYRGVFEFRVVTQSGERLNLQPVRAATGLADLGNVPVRPGVAGCRGNVTLGELVLVAFVDGDPSRPVVIAHDAPDSPGWMPLTIELGGPGALGVARIGDTVQAGPYVGVITSGSARIKAVT